MLRRKKEDTVNGQKLIDLPARTVTVIPCPFDASEQAFYTALETKMADVLDNLLASSKGNSAYISVLLLLLRLRQGKPVPFLLDCHGAHDAQLVIIRCL